MTKDILQQIRESDIKNLTIAKTNRATQIKKGVLPMQYLMPLGIQLELTKKCNLFCKHCYNASGGQDFQEPMTSQKWLEVSSEIVANGGPFQVIISGGEPLIIGEAIYDIMDIYHNDGASFVLISNGLLFSEKHITKLLKYHHNWVQISIDSISEHRHDKFRGKIGSWKQAVKAATMISSSGLPLKIAHSVTPNEINTLDDFIVFCMNIGASAVIIGDIMPSGRAYTYPDIFMNREQKSSFYKKITKLQQKYANSIMIQTSFLMRSQLELASEGPLESIIIRPDGNVRLDCISPFIIGNVLQDSFIDIWRRTRPNIWKDKRVADFISSVDDFGYSNLVENYVDQDITLF